MVFDQHDSAPTVQTPSRDAHAARPNRDVSPVRRSADRGAVTNHRPAGNSPYDLRYVAALLALAAAHFIVAKLGLALSVGRPTLLWLASGVDLAALLTLGYRYWPGVALGALAEALTAGTVFGFALGVGAAAAGGGLELRRRGREALG